MWIKIHAQKIDVNEATKAYVERRLHFALGRFADVVKQVQVMLSDINGPKGGHDKQCRLRVDFKRQATPVLAEILHEDLRTSIDLTADRLGRAVARAVDRQSAQRISRRRAAAVSSRTDQLSVYLG